MTPVRRPPPKPAGGVHSRRWLALLAPGLLALLLAGCMNQTRTAAPASVPGTAAASSQVKGPGPREPLVAPGKTGIPACDDYLASYKQCHLAAGIYTPSTIDAHYRSMHQTLLAQARDPGKRSALAARCISLAMLLKKSLRGKPCTPPQGKAATHP